MNKIGGSWLALAIAAALALPITMVAQNSNIPPPPGDGGLSGSGSVVADTTPEGLTAPPADPHDFEGVWLPGASAGGAAPPPGGADGGANPGGQAGGAGDPAGGPPGGMGGGPPPSAGGASSTLMCAPVQRLQGAGGGMSNFWIMGKKMIVMLSEEDMDVRKIYMNVEHPQQLLPQPNGHAVGKWAGNTLVVDVIGFMGNDGKASDQHVLERIHKEQVGNGWHLVREMTITSNGTTRQQTFREAWRPDLRWYENVCEENYQRFQVVNGEVQIPAQLKE